VTKTIKYSFKQRITLLIAETLGPIFIWLLGVLCFYKEEGSEHLTNAANAGNGVILTIWHGRMLLPIFHLRKRGIVSLVSLHMDGEIITRIVTRLGYVIRRGSPREGSREGFKAILQDLKEGRIVSMFPDGPTGPRHFVHDGVIHLARLTGAPIIPLLFSSQWNWRAKSWDKFMIMKPFSRAVLSFGEPVFIPRRFSETESLEGYRELIKQKLIAFEEKLDLRMNIPIEQSGAE
jgi:lysophospholipid acyltransferase (LPLAT)-like uncharacterized protein